MDTTKKMIYRMVMVVGLLLSTVTLQAETPELQFCGREYKYAEGEDSITLFFNLTDKDRNRLPECSQEDLENYLTIKEDGEVIDQDAEISYVKSGQRIPAEYTFSVLVDLSIPNEYKKDIFDAIGELVNSANDGSVYISFLGDKVTSSIAVTKDNYSTLWDKFQGHANNKPFYHGVYAKLAEFTHTIAPLEEEVIKEVNYTRNETIADRANANPDKNILFIFVEGSKVYSTDAIEPWDVYEYQRVEEYTVPKAYVLYYSKDNRDPGISTTLECICHPKTEEGEPITSRSGNYMPSTNISEMLKNFEDAVSEAMYDYTFKYRVAEDKTYSGKVTYTAQWGKTPIGTGDFSIGSAEKPWPTRVETTSDIVLKYIYALLATLGTIAFFFTIVKILIPYIRFKSFKVKYYKKYVPEVNVSRRICHYCKQYINPGQYIVTKCKHYMHVSCWIQNGYKCAEYGQNCKTGFQSHIEWKQLFTASALKDCSQTISGILAGFVSWILYEVSGRGLFNDLSTKIVEIFYSSNTEVQSLYLDCVNKTSAFLTIGLLLGFFLSLIFRNNDEYKRKDAKVWGKIIGLSILTSIIGMLVFALGAIILCSLLATINTDYVPWWCSLPAYLLFSIGVSLALTIKSTIPIKSAMLGGLLSSLIGFIVLYYSSQSATSNAWMHMLLDFIIYGGGLGASLVTVRMLAERYFLVVQNGVRAGQKIPIHKWMNAIGGGNKVTIGMAGECEIQMNWEKSNKVAQEHVQLYIDYNKQLPMLKPLDTGVIFNTRAELPVGTPSVLSNGDNFKIGDTIFVYQETE